jgi:hypothetical protein
MINVNKFILLLKQTKLIPQKEISVFKTILQKMNRGQSISFKQKQIYNDIVTRASVEPMSNSMPILTLTKKELKKRLANRSATEADAYEENEGVDAARGKINK